MNAKNSGNIFQKIIDREIPAEIVYETGSVLAFKDIFPQAPTHILVIPKKFAENIMEADTAMIADLFSAVQQIVKDHNLSKSGFRVVINNGDQGGQTVPHLHLHILSGRDLKWPPG